jgi:hypothetical protein
MATTTDPRVAMIALAQIRHDGNVRDSLVDDEIAALAQSISLLGQLTRSASGRRERTRASSSPGTSATRRCSGSGTQRSGPRSEPTMRPRRLSAPRRTSSAVSSMCARRRSRCGRCSTWG